VYLAGFILSMKFSRNSASAAIRYTRRTVLSSGDTLPIGAIEQTGLLSWQQPCVWQICDQAEHEWKDCHGVTGPFNPDTEIEYQTGSVALSSTRRCRLKLLNCQVRDHAVTNVSLIGVPSPDDSAACVHACRINELTKSSDTIVLR
jgi:hypothetical protein